MARAATWTPEIELEYPWWVVDAIEETTASAILVPGGLGAGKTYGAAQWFIERCIRNQRSRFSWAVAPTYTQVENTMVPAIQDVLADCHGLFPRRHYTIRWSKPPVLRFKATGHEIHFHSGVKPDLMVGPSISHYWITEAGFMAPAVFEKCEARARCPKAELIQALYDGTPEGLLNRFAEFNAFDGDWSPDGSRRRFTLWTEENRFLKPSTEVYVERLRRAYAYDPQKLESYLYGRFVSFSKGSAYWNFIQSRCVTLDVKPDPVLPIIFTIDWGVAPLAWVGLQRQPHEKRGNRYLRYVALAEGSGEAKGIVNMVAEFIAAFDPAVYGDTPIELDGGHDGYAGSMYVAGCAFDEVVKLLRKYYRNVTVTAEKSAPDIQPRLNAVNNLFIYERFVVAAWLRNLIESLATSSLKPGQWKLEKKAEKDKTHYADAVGYPLYWRTRYDDYENPNHKIIYGTNQI